MLKALTLLAAVSSVTGCAFSEANPGCIDGEMLRVVSVTLFNPEPTSAPGVTRLVYGPFGGIAVGMPRGGGFMDTLEFSDIAELLQTGEGDARYCFIFPDGSVASGSPIAIEATPVEGESGRYRMMYPAQLGDPQTFEELEVVVELGGACF